jgi:hypothetical protein
MKGHAPPGKKTRLNSAISLPPLTGRQQRRNIFYITNMHATRVTLGGVPENN